MLLSRSLKEDCPALPVSTSLSSRERLNSNARRTMLCLNVLGEVLGGLGAGQGGGGTMN